jgi:hypothetical protein
VSAPGPTADDLDKELLDQLHQATLKASDSCFELKKLCATILAPTVTVVTIFLSKRLDQAVFLVGLLVVLAFWLADAVGYYYQRKLRASMSDVWKRRASRCDEPYSDYPKTSSVRWFSAAFNYSMIYYAILGGLLLVGLLLFAFGLIHSDMPGLL